MRWVRKGVESKGHRGWERGNERGSLQGEIVAVEVQSAHGGECQVALYQAEGIQALTCLRRSARHSARRYLVDARLSAPSTKQEVEASELRGCV